MALTITQKPLAGVTATLSGKTPIGSVLRSAEWENVPAQLRDSAFFSAGVESVRALSEAQAGLRKILELSRDPNGAISMDRSKFVAEMQKLSNQLGLRNTDSNKRGGLEDFGSERRLRLIFEQQIGQAQSKAYYLSGQDPDVLDAWPAQELVRLRASKVPRNWLQRWTDAGGQLVDGRMIALKTSPIWTKLSRFDRPWPPFDYGSGMGLDEIDRETAESLGLIRPGEVIKPSVARDEAAMKASVKGLAPDMLKALRHVFGDQIHIKGDEVLWRNNVPASNPAPAPEPEEDAPEPEAAAPASVADIAPRLTEIAGEMETLRAQIKSSADYKTRLDASERVNALIEESRNLVSVPEGQRRAVTYTNKKLPPAIARTGADGAALVSRYVHPDYVPQGLTAKRIKGRAFYQPTSRTINVSPYDPADGVAHEVVHDIEFSHPEVSRSTKEFLRKRSGGLPPKRLRDLTGNRRYKLDEITYEDEWLARGGVLYSGKVYPIAATELLTIGIQRLHADPAAFHIQDPEYFEFVVKTLRKW